MENLGDMNVNPESVYSWDGSSVLQHVVCIIATKIMVTCIAKLHMSMQINLLTMVGINFAVSMIIPYLWCTDET